MKFAAALVALPLALAAGDVEYTPLKSEVTAKFMGASGGIKIMQTLTDSEGVESETSLQVSQAKLEACDENGTKLGGKDGHSINVAGQNSWTPITTTSGPSTKGDGTATVATTTFTVVEDDVTFNLIAHISNDQYTVYDPTPCSECAITEEDVQTSGDCKNPNTNMCEAAVDGACATEGFEQCTQAVNLMDNDLKFSMVVNGWKFADPSHKLCYGLIIKDKTKGVDGGKPKKSKTGELDFGGGSFSYPSTGVVTGVVGSPDKIVPVSFAIDDSKEGKTEIDFRFSAFEDGETLYYDPTLATGAGNAVKVGAFAGIVGVLGVASLLF
jgi:hypothetical protein